MGIFKIVRVHDIILDKTHTHYKGEDSIGVIRYTSINDPSVGSNTKHYKIAKPLYSNINHYPIPNELVYIITGPSPKYRELGNYIKYYLPPLAIQKSPTLNGLPVNISNDSGKYYTGLYFRERNIRPLQPYEGDIIFEGRFGQSIRFGSTVDNMLTLPQAPWSHGNRNVIGDPITIIRNGQSLIGDINEQKTDHIVEDLNNDNSAIYLCSNQQLLDFIPASLHDESYLDEMLKESETIIEPTLNINDDIPENTTEDIALNTADRIPLQELQETDELNDLKTTNTAQYDISETEAMALGSNDIIDLDSSTIVPDNVDMNFLNEEI